MKKVFLNDGERLTSLCSADKAIVAIALESVKAAVVLSSRITGQDEKTIHDIISSAAGLKVGNLSEEELNKYIAYMQPTKEDLREHQQ